MVLSIGMIVKNEEKYLEECLMALQPILDELDSELIIADTGSTDRTIEIAKKFTNNVFHFDWINDFSAARNSTLEKAQGEWYMFVDADEIAADCTDIIKFFKSGEYKRFKSAAYIQRSYIDETDRKECVDFRVMRAVQREANTKFVNPIHERLSPFYYPTKYLDFVVIHYGYMYIGENGKTDLAHEKSKRNLELLLNELNNNEIGNERCNIYNQIADCYEITEDFENTFKYLDMGLEKVDHHSINIVPYYSHKIFVLSKLERLDEVIEVSNEYFDIEINPFHTKELASDCYIRAMRGYAYYKRHEYRSAIHELVEFLNLYRKYCNGKLNTEDLMMVMWRTTESVVQASYDIFFRCCYQEKQFALANDYTKAIPLEKYFDDHNFMITHLKIRVEIMDNVGYHSLNALYNKLDEFGRNYLIALIRPRVFKTEPEKRKVIIKKLASLGGAPLELAEIYQKYFDKGNTDINLIGSFLQKYGSENSEDMLYLLMSQSLDITPFVCAYDFFADRAVQLLFVNYNVPMSMFENYDIGVISNEGLVRSVSLYGWIMLRALERDFPISKVFEKYGRLGMRWYNEFENNEALPGDIRAAILVNNVVSANKARNKTQFMNAIRELKRIVPDLIPLADAYKEENKDAFKAARVNPEFERLAVQVKQNIRGMISAGNISEARKSLKEFEGLCPDDPEIEVIKDEINNSLQ